MKTPKMSGYAGYAGTLGSSQDFATFVLDVTKLAKLVNDKVLIEVQVARFPIHERIFADEFFDTIRKNNLGDGFMDACIDHINHEFMKAQVIRHIVDHAE